MREKRDRETKKGRGYFGLAPKLKAPFKSVKVLPRNKLKEVPKVF